MIDYTPYRKYTEILDDPPLTKVWGKRLLLTGSFVCIAAIIAAGFYYLPTWVMLVVLIPIALLLFPIGISFFSIYCISSLRPQSKAKEANTIRNVLGFDIGNDFKLLRTSGHDYDEFLFIFSDESFKPLRRHLETIPDEGEPNVEEGRMVRHSFKGDEGRGFYLCDSRIKNACGNTESIEVDYEERTLKHKFVVY